MRLNSSNSALGHKEYGSNSIYRISANSFRGNYSFLDLGVRKLFKGGKYKREETIVFLLFRRAKLYVET